MTKQHDTRTRSGATAKIGLAAIFFGLFLSLPARSQTMPADPASCNGLQDRALAFSDGSARLVSSRFVAAAASGRKMISIASTRGRFGSHGSGQLTVCGD